MKAARPGGHPDFLQRFLQVDNNLTPVGESQRDHAARALIVNVGIAGVVDAVAGLLNGSQGLLGVVQVIKVGHYNLVMFSIYRIIAATFVVFVLPACGQKGPLFLAPQSVPYKLLPSSPVDALSVPAAALPAAAASAAK